jgi:hypothetical protein
LGSLSFRALQQLCNCTCFFYSAICTPNERLQCRYCYLTIEINQRLLIASIFV